MMKHINTFHHILLSLFLSISSMSFAQEKELPEHEKKAIQEVFTGNEQMIAGDVLEGEKSYRKAIATDPNNLESKYNLGVSYYKTKSFQEAAQRNKEAVKQAKTKAEKHIANHNLGNSYLQMGKPDEAIEAYKNALRNNPSDDETRYNLAVAKQMKQQQDQNKDQDKEGDSKDKKEGGEGDEKKEDQDKKEGEDEKDKDKKEGEDEKDDEGKPEDEKEDEGDGDDKEEEEKKPTQPKEGKLSPEQVKSLLEAMAEEEKKVQDKMSEKKGPAVKIKSDKDW